MDHNGEIIIYTPKGKSAGIEVKMIGETIWLTQKQIADLFGKDSDTIGHHINNIYKNKELGRRGTTANFAVVQTEGGRKVSRKLKCYSLDLIISVGYRVNSKRGTEFRIWANKVLKEYLTKGYALNKKRLSSQTIKIKELEKTIKLLGGILEKRTLENEEAVGLLKVIHDYTYALDLLDQYDHQNVKVEGISKRKGFKITYEKAIRAIKELRKKFGGSDIFALEKDDSFKSSIETIYQTFSGKDLYPSVEEKAAQLLYFIVKNHSFVDGNKRIAAFIFIWFLDSNKLLYKQDGSKKIENNALVALTLMIAESKPSEKDTIVKIIVNLINKKN